MKKFISKSLVSLLLASGLLFNVGNVALGSEETDDKNVQHTIYLASDSTVANWDPKYAPQAGWGMMLGKYFKDNIKVENNAIAGISSKTFITEGYFDKILQKIKPGDYLFIQFGHNDATPSRPERYTDPNTTFKDYINQYIDQTREKGATPVLITPVARRTYNEKTGLFSHAYEDYSMAMKQIAQEKDVVLLDLSTRSKVYLETIGIENSKSIFLYVKPGESKGEFYRNGIEDKTHFQEYGADQMAKLVIEEILLSPLPLKEYVIDERKNAPLMIKTFDDIANHWAKGDIEELTAIGVVNGVKDNLFEPDRNITRAEFIKMAMLGVKAETKPFKNIYKDVDSNAWYAEYIQGAYEMGFIPEGMIKDGNLEPDQLITREEIASVLMHVYNKNSDPEANITLKELNGFTDESQISEWAIKDIQTAYSLDIMTGVSETELKPKETATRAEAAVMLRRTLWIVK